MPLYQHTSGERERAVAGSYEDRRLSASASWSLVEETAPAPVENTASTPTPTAPTEPTPSEADTTAAPVPAEQPAASGEGAPAQGA